MASVNEILEDCYFVPKSTMEKVIELMEIRDNREPFKMYCKRNLLHVQQNRTTKKFRERNCRNYRYFEMGWRSVHRRACCKAVYSQDWDKLLYLLKKCPPWEHNFIILLEGSLYVRALLILLMYHKSSQAQGLLNEYLHLVWSCRTDETKKAILKILLSLPEKIKDITFTRVNEIEC